MKKNLIDLTRYINGSLVGDGNVEISGVADLQSVQAGEITFLANARHVDRLVNTGASAVIVPKSIQHAPVPIIRVDDPYLGMALIHTLFVDKSFSADGISPKAHVGEGGDLSTEITIGPMAVIGHRVSIAERVTIHPGVVVGDDVTIGSNTEIYPNVTIGKRCIIGKGVIIHAGTVIGADGFGYATDKGGHHLKRPQVGIVQIDDDVEIGANCCVDRATFGITWIKRGSKIDNLVQVAHNVVIGEDAIIVAQTGISGSTSLGNNVVLGGQVGISGHLHIGNRVMIGSKSGVHSNLSDNELVSGYPAFSHKLWLRVCAVIPRLPELMRDVRALKKQLKNQER